MSSTSEIHLKLHFRLVIPWPDHMQSMVGRKVVNVAVNEIDKDIAKYSNKAFKYIVH